MLSREWFDTARSIIGDKEAHMSAKESDNMHPNSDVPPIRAADVPGEKVSIGEPRALENAESGPESIGKLADNNVLLLIPFALFMLFGIFAVVMALTH
jgi:hypothetical protein